MQVLISLVLPHAAASVSVARQTCRSTLRCLGLDDACVSDIEIALSEACTNVLKHGAGSHDRYEIELNLSEDRCHIRVMDTGKGITDPGVHEHVASDDAESGRGIHLMRALVDDLHYESQSDDGTIVHLTKFLDPKKGSLISGLAADAAAG